MIDKPHLPLRTSVTATVFHSVRAVRVGPPGGPSPWIRPRASEAVRSAYGDLERTRLVPDAVRQTMFEGIEDLQNYEANAGEYQCYEEAVYAQQRDVLLRYIHEVKGTLPTGAAEMPDATDRTDLQEEAFVLDLDEDGAHVVVGPKRERLTYLRGGLPISVTTSHRGLGWLVALLMGGVMQDTRRGPKSEIRSALRRIGIMQEREESPVPTLTLGSALVRVLRQRTKR